MVAALAGWLAERDLSLGDLRTGQSLEEAYLAITGARDVPETGDARAPAPGGVGGRGASGVDADAAARLPSSGPS